MNIPFYKKSLLKTFTKQELIDIILNRQETLKKAMYINNIPLNVSVEAVIADGTQGMKRG